ncbi:MAG: gliding-motility protein MglA [Chloroflexia bacterium]|nr:gliding-motility protein MglA [Chloroflexia bacterium]
MFINRRRKELNLKIVYYGPALSGKTTNLQMVHAKTRPDLRGELISLKTREDRTVFFDYLLLELGQVAGLTPKFNLYTVPGQVYYAASRKLVLQGVDGVIFVADSQPSRLKANQESLQDLQRYLRELGYDAQQLPLVVQFNKRDLPRVLPVSFMRKYLQLNGSTPVYEAVAVQGQGVFDTLKAMINRVVGQIQRGGI